MTPTDAIVASVVTITATTLIKNVKQKKKADKFAPILFGFLLLIFLLIMATFAPTIAKGLAYMGMVGAFVVNGPTVFGIFENLGKTKKS